MTQTDLPSIAADPAFPVLNIPLSRSQRGIAYLAKRTVDVLGACSVLAYAVRCVGLNSLS